MAGPPGNPSLEGLAFPPASPRWGCIRRSIPGARAGAGHGCQRLCQQKPRPASVNGCPPERGAKLLEPVPVHVLQPKTREKTGRHRRPGVGHAQTGAPRKDSAGEAEAQGLALSCAPPAPLRPGGAGGGLPPSLRGRQPTPTLSSRVPRTGTTRRPRTSPASGSSWPARPVRAGAPPAAASWATRASRPGSRPPR